MWLLVFEVCSVHKPSARINLRPIRRYTPNNDYGRHRGKITAHLAGPHALSPERLDAWDGRTDDGGKTPLLLACWRPHTSDMCRWLRAAKHLVGNLRCQRRARWSETRVSPRSSRRATPSSGTTSPVCAEHLFDTCHTSRGGSFLLPLSLRFGGSVSC